MLELAIAHHVLPLELLGTPPNQALQWKRSARGSYVTEGLLPAPVELRNNANTNANANADFPEPQTTPNGQLHRLLLFAASTIPSD